MRILLAIKKFIQEFPAHFLATCLTLLILAGVSAHAMTSYDVTNEVQMNLDVSITGTQTTGIIIAAPQLNAADHTFATTTGGILRIRWGVYREDILYTSASVNATTKKVTLTGVTRNICPQYTRTYVSCGDGRAWGKGAIVELNQDARLFNLKANIDRNNTFTASGAIAFSGSGSFVVPRFASMDEANRQLGSSPRDGSIFYNTGSGTNFQRVAGAWVAIGSATTANATTTTSGKAELGVVNDILTGTITGDSGGPVFLGIGLITRTSTGTTQANKVPALEETGYLSGSLLGSNPSANTFLRGDQTFATVGSIFGNSASGSVTIAANTNLNPRSQINYSDFTINVGATLSTDRSNIPLRINVAGNATINGSINLNSKGGTGGTAGTFSGANPTAGGSGTSIVNGANYTNTAGGAGINASGQGTGGGGGASSILSGSGVLSVLGGRPISATGAIFLTSMFRNVVCGSGGGGGGGGDSGVTAANGAAGGGAMTMYIAGNLTLGASSSITANGASGIAATGANNGGGGGGGGGDIFIFVAGSITNNGVTLSAAGGNGGTKAGAGKNGGPGARGRVTIISLTTGTVIQY